MLLKSFWKKEVTYIDAKPGFEKEISAGNAAVVIGDRTFALNGGFEYEYDLAEEWKKFTGLPFVFAAWISTEKLPADFVDEFNSVLKLGIESIAEAVNESDPPKNLSKEKTLEYLTERIDYRLDNDKRRALDLFLAEIKKL